MSSYSFTIPGSHYPTSIEELRELCPRQNEGLHCLRQHVRCLKPMTKRAMVSFIESRRKHVKKLCTDMKGQTAKEFIDTFSCIKRHPHMTDKFIQSEIEAIKRMEAIMSDQVRDFKERFQRACCSISYYRSRSLEDMSPECSQGPNVAVLEAAIDSVVGEALEFACPDAKSSVCNSMKPLKLAAERPTKSLTRAGTDLMIMLTTDDEDDASTDSTAASGANATMTTQATRAPKRMRKP